MVWVDFESVVSETVSVLDPTISVDVTPLVEEPSDVESCPD